MKENMQHPGHDEQDRAFTITAKGVAWDCVTVAAQILTILCVVKGNPAWKACLSLIFLGMAASMVVPAGKNKMAPRIWGAVFLGAVGMALMVWFVITE